MTERMIGDRIGGLQISASRIESLVAGIDRLLEDMGSFESEHHRRVIGHVTSLTDLIQITAAQVQEEAEEIRSALRSSGEGKAR